MERKDYNVMIKTLKKLKVLKVLKVKTVKSDPRTFDNVLNKPDCTTGCLIDYPHLKILKADCNRFK